jgi:hypothetical protein
MKRKLEMMMIEEENTNKKRKRTTEPTRKRKFECLPYNGNEEEDVVKKTRTTYHPCIKEKICRRDILLYL